MERTIFTKEEAGDIILGLYGEVPERLRNRMLFFYQKMSDYAFIKEFRKCTDLKLCSFSPNKFYIRYE